MSIIDNFYEKISTSKVMLYSFVGVLLFIVFVLAALIIISIYTPTPKPNLVATSTNQGGFPHLPDNDKNDAYYKYMAGIDASKIMFADFYKNPQTLVKYDLKSYHLPIEIKVDAANYYEISRKLKLDPYIEKFNRDGFAVMENQFKGSADNFYAMYDVLDRNNIPTLLTSDFLYYYYQTKLKEVFKDVERKAFYPNMWQMINELFETSSGRYLRKYSDVGLVNDNILEGARLESAFLAVAIELLKPEPKQVSKRADLKEERKFSTEEKIIYDFTLPAYLKDDVAKEVEMIKAAKHIDRSPVFRYPVDYKKYQIPGDYKNNAKLRNFYLTLKWLNSVFPLYFRGKDCPDCLLDRNDWTVNMTAAGFLTKDIFDNQKLKNEWAIIYKFVSFFSGLRQDLTYLDYNAALVEKYNKNYDIEEVFNREQFVGTEILELQKIIGKARFSPIEGMLDRDHGKNPQIGLRLLQLPYWPNDYIFNYLSGDDLLYLGKSRNAKLPKMTLCQNKNNRAFYRCSGFGMDVINLIHPIKQNTDFSFNTNYANYQTKSRELKNILNSFTDYTWNNNVYWATLDTIKNMFDVDREKYPVYMRGNNWLQIKDVNTALGAWANIHLPMDEVIGDFSGTSNRLGGVSNCDENNYIEPNLSLVKDMLAKSKMLKKMLEILNVSNETNQVTIQLDDLNKILENLVSINVKLLEGKILNYDDCEFMQVLTNNYKVDVENSKIFTIKTGTKSLKESIAGIKMLGVVYQKEDKKIIAVGPIFNYYEGR